MMPARPALRLNTGVDPLATATSTLASNVPARDPFFTPRSAVEIVAATLDTDDFALTCHVLETLHDIATAKPCAHVHAAARASLLGG